ncbi:MAG TPA: hypothetical protein VFE96_02785 [Candidatus Bathyarchaeia archaeon]|jgi:hypothetical protein|nr:hypothetical protein [Candidatus Bathyarchaeia archaeon]
MSKVRGRENDLLNNLTDAGVANELDSRLRDLEKNIAVAREFIKLADESYSELRHKWNLLQQEARTRTETQTPEQTKNPEKKSKTRSRTKEEFLGEENTEQNKETAGSKGSKTSKRFRLRSFDGNKTEKNQKEREISSEHISPINDPKTERPLRDHGQKRKKNTLGT